MGAPHDPRDGPVPFYIDFAPLRERRRAILWSQRDLAQRVGCARATINRIERNITVPSVPLLIGLSRALGVPSEYLYTVVDER